VVMMVMVVVVVMMMHRSSHRSGRRRIGRGSARRRGGFLSNGVSRQADRENGGAYETLDHAKTFCCRSDPQRVLKRRCRAMCLNSR
jgi:hypothetical protein